MKPRELLTYVNKSGLLGRLSGGHPGRAALILIGVNLLLPIVCALFWVIGWAPIFSWAHWIVAVIASAVFLAMTLWSMFAFGFWGVGASSGQDGGDQLGGDFTPGAAFALGWLRWLIQVVCIGVCVLPLVATWTDTRLWHLVSRPEIDGLPERAATMPVPRDWTLTDTSTTDAPPGLPREVYEFEQAFHVPRKYTYGDFEKWFTTSQWQAFGTRQEVECDAEIERCEADLTPPPGEEVKYSVEAWYATGPIEDLPPSVRVTLQYWPPEPGE